MIGDLELLRISIVVTLDQHGRKVVEIDAAEPDGRDPETLDLLGALQFAQQQIAHDTIGRADQ